MKRILMIAILLIASLTGFSQNYLLQHGLTIVNDKGTPVDAGEVTSEIGEKFEYIIYEDNTKVEIYYLDVNRFCVVYVIIDNYSELTQYIKNLNKEYVVVDEYNWKYYSRDYVYTAKLMDFTETQFKLLFTFKSRGVNI